MAPIQVKIRNEEKNIQVLILFTGFVFVVFFIFFIVGKIIIIMIDNSRAITPPSLFGIERRIA